MKHRNPIMVLLLSFVTFGIYVLVWCVTTKDGMNAKGADIPTAWLLIIPIVNFLWYWKFSEGVETVTKKEMGAGAAFILLILLGPIGMAIVQSSLNKIAA